MRRLFPLVIAALLLGALATSVAAGPNGSIIPPASMMSSPKLAR